VLDKSDQASDALKAKSYYKVKADKRDFGWSTVNEYLSDEVASNSDDEKRMYRPQRTA